MRAVVDRVLDDLPQLSAVLDRARAKFISMNGPAGTLHLSEEEATATRRLGCHVPTRRRLTLAELDRALRESSIGEGLRRVLEAVGGPLQTREEADAARAALWTRLQMRLFLTPKTDAGRTRLARWVEVDSRHLELLSHQKDGVQDSTALQVATALDQLPADGTTELLAHFAARVAGNAHTFDEDRPAGRLLLRALAALSGAMSANTNREGREEVLAAAGLLLDDLSSDVLIIGFEGGAEYVEAATMAWHPIRLPLYALVRNASLRPVHGRSVFAVENPPVFRMLMDRAAALSPERRPALVCTSGHFSVAVRRLLDQLARDGARILYSGDFDARGVDIALRLRSRLPTAVSLWRMGPEEHAFACQGPTAGPGIDAATRTRIAADLPELARLLAGGTAHQETLIEQLWADVHEICMTASPSANR